MNNIGILLGALVIGLFFSGCQELIPQKVEQKIAIGDDGSMSVSYSGTFLDLYELIVFISKERGGDNIPSSKDVRKEMLEHIKSTPFMRQVKEIKPHQYSILWEENINFQEGSQLIKTNYADSKIPRFITAYNISNLSKKAFAINMEGQDDYEESDDNSPLNELIQKYKKGFEAKVIIEINEDFVLKHNSKYVTKLSNGKTRFEWKNIKFPFDEDTLIFEFSSNPMDKKIYLLMNAPVGSDCKSIIGTNCKCGHFILASPMEALVNVGYTIETPQGIHKGCSNSQGETISIESPITGVCNVRLLNKEESEELCGEMGVIQE